MDVVQPEQVARSGGLQYVSDQSTGLRRIANGKGFRYVTANGKPVRSAHVIRRIQALVIPPAWKDVWICPTAHGHLQATGRDVRGRKQYRYHPRWCQIRDASKYHRLIAFGRALPRIRRRTNRDVRRRGLPREKVLATVVRLLESSLIRVGNDEYARQNGSFGLTTMRDHHARITGGRIRFQFKGKGGVHHVIDIGDKGLAEVVRRCQELPGQDLFQYRDADGKVCDVTSTDINDYLRQIAGEEFTAKDFRTWAGTVLAAHALQEFRDFDSQAQAKRNVVRAIENVAKRLGNTKAVCRKCYIHPAVVDAYLDGSLRHTVTQQVKRELKTALRRLPAEEAAVLAFLYERLQRKS